MFRFVSDSLSVCQSSERAMCASNCRNLADGVYALCSDCRKYVICRSKTAEIIPCPQKQYWGFDVATNQCQYKPPDCYDCAGMLNTVPLLYSLE